MAQLPQFSNLCVTQEILEEEGEGAMAMHCFGVPLPISNLRRGIRKCTTAVCYVLSWSELLKELRYILARHIYESRYEKIWQSEYKTCETDNNT
jgi:hypothetical protein